MTGRPGPVHVEFPEDLLMQKGEADSAGVWGHDEFASATPVADPAAVQRAAEVILDAKLPLLHCGGGSQRSGAGAEARALAEYLGCPVTTGAGSRGIIPDGHPLVTRPVSTATAVVKNMADVVLAVGTRFGELDFWGRPPVWGDAARQKVVQVDIDPRNIGLNRPVEVGLVGDARAVLGQLLEAVRRLTGPRPVYEQSAMIRDLDDKWREEMDQRVADPSRSPMVPGQIFTVVNDFFPADAIVALDGGNTCVWAAHYLMVREQRSMLWTSNAGHLGTGLPYAIGAKMAAPDRTVYAVCGDSAFRFNMQELETAARYELPITFIVAVDGAFGMEKSAQRRVWGREAPWFGCDHAPVRFDRVAEAMGCHGEYAESADELRQALERAAASGKPAVVHAAVDPVENENPPGLALWAAARSGARS
jgi:acetolactate synthase-1/2/3 large subunit